MNLLSVKKLILLIFGLSLMFTCESKVRNNRPLVWDMAQIEQLKKEGGKGDAVRTILKDADGIRLAKPVAVTDKQRTSFEPDKHYFCSIGPYWWPDSLNKGKYINKDGEVNPESKLYDNVKAIEMVNRCLTLSKAFYITENKQYYDAFLRQLRVWFINKDTYMYPTFEYAQVVPGQNNNKGRSTGMITAYVFNSLIESIRLVNGIKRIDRRTMKKIQKWFLSFAEESEKLYGAIFHDANNNISLAFDVTIANMYLFAGQEEKAKQIVDDFATLRIEKQILDDGRQPSELIRTDAFSYSVYNLTHIIDFCFLAQYWYPNYYMDHRTRIDNAFNFLEQFVDNTEAFPYQQITKWETCKKDYYYQLNRIKALELQ